MKKVLSSVFLAIFCFQAKGGDQKEAEKALLYLKERASYYIGEYRSTLASKLDLATSYLSPAYCQREKALQIISAANDFLDSPREKKDWHAFLRKSQ
jgi:hypothetical protein